MKWFKRHLHWTWLICLIVSTLVGLLLGGSNDTKIGGISGGSWFSFFCMIVVDGWILNEKKRSLWFIFLCVLIWIPLILGNERINNMHKLDEIRTLNKPTVSDLAQSQTSAERPSDGYSETHTHLDRTGDI